MKAGIIGIILTVLASPALAQQAPCSHSATTIQMGGVDLDVMKCHLATTQTAFGQMAVRVTSLMADLDMAQSELAAAKAETARVNKQLVQAKKELAAAKAKTATKK